MGGSKEGNVNIERWIRKASKELKSDVSRLNYSVCEIQGKRINIKYRQYDNRGWYWHSVSRRSLEKNDFFVFLCGSYRYFCIIPRRIMKRYFSKAHSSGLHCHVNYVDGKFWSKSSNYDVEPFLDNWQIIRSNKASRSIRAPRPEKRKTPDFIDIIESDPKRREKIRQYVTKRERRFRKRVIALYRNSCAFCGMQCGLVEAAHILGVADNGKEDVRNGIALCPTHHTALDMGLLHLKYANNEFRITVDKEKLDSLKHRHGIGQLLGLDNKQVQVPLDKKHYKQVRANIERRLQVFD